MVPSAENFQVRSASEGGADSENQFAGQRLGNRYAFNADVFAPMEDRGLHGSLAEPARGLDGIAADLNYLFNGVAADMKDFFDGAAANVEDVFNGGAADLEDVFNRSPSAFDGALYRIWHRFLLEGLRSCSG
jgi:hypothetical protein